MRWLRRLLVGVLALLGALVVAIGVLSAVVALTEQDEPDAPGSRRAQARPLLVSEESFVVAAGRFIEYWFDVPAGGGVVTIEWASVNRNPAGGAAGAVLGLASTLLATGSLGASEGSGGDIDVTLRGPGIAREWPRSVRSSTAFEAAAGRHTLTFANGFSLLTNKEVALRITIQP